MHLFLLLNLSYANRDLAVISIGLRRRTLLLLLAMGLLGSLRLSVACIWSQNMERVTMQLQRYRECCSIMTQPQREVWLSLAFFRLGMLNTTSH